MPDFRKEISTRVAALKLDPARESEIVEELAQHLQDKYQELVAAGASPDEAQKAIEIDLNDSRLIAGLRPVTKPVVTRLAAGEDQRGNFFSGIWKDIQFGFRLLRLNPAFAFVAILSLTLGIGANTAIFQLLDAVRLRTLPVTDPQQLAQVRVQQTPNGRTGGFSGRHPDLTYALWENILQQQQAFTTIGAWTLRTYNLNRGGEARDARVMLVSGGFFDTLGVHPERGRLIGPADDRIGACNPAAAISDSFWHGQFGSSDASLGSKILVEGHPFEIIGITPSSFFGPEVGRSFDIAIPLCSEPTLNGENSSMKLTDGWWLAAIGRLKPGWTLQKASAQLAAISPGIFETTAPSTYDAEDRKSYSRFILEALPAGNGISSLRKTYETPLWMLMAISGLVLLIACANLANLMVARASARQREMAVRLALGASRARLVRQMLAESLLLAAIGAACGIVLAQVLSRILISFLSTKQSVVFLTLTPDWRLLAFTVLSAVLTCILFGLTPAIQAARTPPAEVMKSGSRGITAGPGRFQFRRILVVSQVALSLVLLIGALLFVGTFRNLMTLDAGFKQEGLLAVDVDFTSLNIPVENRIQYKRELMDRVKGLPGVRSSAEAFIIPLSGSGWNENINIPEAGLRRKIANYNRISAEYFHTVGTTLLAGRDFNDHDTLSSPLVAIVTESYAKKFLNGRNPVGTTFGMVQQSNKPDTTYRIVGLVKDAKYTNLREEFTPIIFLPVGQQEHPDPGMEIMIRSDQTLPELVVSVKQAIAEINPAIVLKFQPFRAMVRDGLIRERLMATLSGFFGLIAAILAMTGLYGVISYMVARRRNEIGVRIALGANRGSILSMILREAGVQLGAGVIVGLLLALVGGHTASSLLFGMRPYDPKTLVAAVALLAFVAVAAAFFPARRGAALDPMQALREE